MIDLLTSGNITAAIAFLCAAVLSIMLHELGHGYAAILNGDNTPLYQGRMTLNPLSHFDPLGFLLFLFVGFGWAKPVQVNANNFKNYRKGLFTVAIAGVTVNFILLFISVPLCKLMMMLYQKAYFASQGEPSFLLFLCELVFSFFMFLISINPVLMVFNLMPVYPLDGFRVVESVTRGTNRYVQMMYRYGRYAMVAFLVLIYALNFMGFDLLGLLASWVSWPVNKFWNLIFGLFA